MAALRCATQPSRREEMATIYDREILFKSILKHFSGCPHIFFICPAIVSWQEVIVVAGRAANSVAAHAVLQNAAQRRAHASSRNRR